MKRIIVLVLVFVTPSLALKPGFVPLAWAAENSKKTESSEIVSKAISERFAALGDWQADISQSEESMGLGQGAYSQGSFYFAAPNRFVYDINMPIASSFVSNGQQAWYIRYPEGRDKPAHVRYFPSVSDIELDRYLIVFRGLWAKDESERKRLSDSFDIKAQSAEDSLNLSLKPLGSREISEISVVFKANQDFPSQAVIVDSLSNKTVIEIRNARKVKKVDPTRFRPRFQKDSEVEQQGAGA